MSRVFETQITIKFRDADPAQIMYFGNLFSFAHDCFEEFIVAAGYAWKEWFRKGDYMIPIRHAESDFLSPFRPGETYDVSVTVAQIRDTSFQMKYVFSKEGRRHGVVTMVHAVLDSATMQKTPVPRELRDRLTPYVEASA
ncbi:MAG: acyl-CoA thioesterase [Bdellovibrionaceae bacterium]|nr:acyl-CoA thioesterase [Pseudobdellovibrionaceae bacterium]